MMVSTTKAVPPAIPLNSPAVKSNDPIDLTENDEESEVPRRLNLDKTFKIISQSTLNTTASATSSTQLVIY